MELMRRRVIPGTLEERQQTLHAFIKMLDNQDYEDEVDSLCRIIVRHLHDDDVWTPANMRSFQRTYYRKAKEFAMVSGQSQFRLRFFLCYYFVNWTLEENRILGEIFLEFGKGLRHFVHSGLKDGFTGMERWGALVLSASCGNGEAFRHLARLMQTAGGDDLDTVRKLFPYLALVRQQQAVDLLVPFLSDRHLQASEGCGFESGDGLAFQAAKALVSMVEGVPVFDVDRFREDDRRRLEQWFQAHHGYRFKTWNLWPQRMAGQRSGMNVKDSGIETPEVLEQRIVRRVSGAIFGY
ncbi:MAG: hypothetical protein IJJ33_08550 [Victivallales bacterium]|nr:hypothetical protein [Victivallales bacterium]